eukprot:s308_g27.t1
MVYPKLADAVCKANGRPLFASARAIAKREWMVDVMRFKQYRTRRRYFDHLWKNGQSSIQVWTQQPLLNPLAMMMNPMAGMMNPLAMMNPMMSHLGGMPDGNHAQPLQDDDDADEGLLNTGSGSSSAASVASGQSGVHAVAVAPIVSQIAAAPAPDVPHEEDVHQRLADALITRSATYLKK